MAEAKEENKSLKNAFNDMVERVSVAGWQEAFAEKVTWISHIFKIILIIFSGFCLFYIYKSVKEWRLHNGYKDEIDDTAEMETMPFTNVTICAPQVYFNQSFIKEQLNLSTKIIDSYTKASGKSADDLYEKLALYLPLILRPRALDMEILTFMRKIIRQSPQLQDFSRFSHDAYSPCENMLKKCTFDGKEFDCCKNAVQAIDDDGVCYVIMMNFDSDNAIPSAGTFHQRRPGPAGGLTVEASMSLKDFPMLEDDADNGFKVLVDPTPYSLLLAPVPAPHNAETFIKVTPSKRTLLVNCATPGHLKLIPGEEALVYHDSEGFHGFLQGFQSMAYMYYTCTVPMYFYRPNSSVVCDSLPIFTITAGFAMSFSEDFTKAFDAVLPGYREKITEMWGSTMKRSVGLKHCTRWTYTSSPSFVDLEKETEDSSRMYSRIHIYYGDFGYRQYNEVKESNWYLELCDLGNVIGLYWGMSLMSIFHVLYYVPRYFYYLRKARIEKAKVHPEVQ